MKTKNKNCTDVVENNNNNVEKKMNDNNIEKISDKDWWTVLSQNNINSDESKFPSHYIKIEAANFYNKMVYSATTVLLSIAAIFFLLSFHIVPSSLTVIPKENLTFANTFVSINKYIKDYNDADFFTKIQMTSTHLHNELIRRRIVIME